MGVIDRYHGDASRELVIPGQVLCAVGSGASLVSFSGGSNTFVEYYKEYLGSGYMRGLLEYSTFHTRLLKRCLQETASTVLRTLEPCSMTGFIGIRLKGAEHRDWMQSRQSLRRAIETGDLSLPGLLDVVSNIIGVWPLIVSHLKETGKKDRGDSLVVWFSSFSFSFFPFSCLEKRARWILLHQPVGENEVPLVPSHFWNVLVFSSAVKFV